MATNQNLDKTTTKTAMCTIVKTYSVVAFFMREQTLSLLRGINILPSGLHRSPEQLPLVTWP